MCLFKSKWIYLWFSVSSQTWNYSKNFSQICAVDCWPRSHNRGHMQQTIIKILKDSKEEEVIKKQLILLLMFVWFSSAFGIAIVLMWLYFVVLWSKYTYIPGESIKTNRMATLNFEITIQWTFFSFSSFNFAKCLFETIGWRSLSDKELDDDDDKTKKKLGEKSRIMTRK